MFRWLQYNFNTLILTDATLILSFLPSPAFNGYFCSYSSFWWFYSCIGHASAQRAWTEEIDNSIVEQVKKELKIPLIPFLQLCGLLLGSILWLLDTRASQMMNSKAICVLYVFLCDLYGSGLYCLYVCEWTLATATIATNAQRQQCWAWSWWAECTWEWVGWAGTVRDCTIDSGIPQHAVNSCSACSSRHCGDGPLVWPRKMWE